MPAIISQVEGLGKSGQNCAGIRIRFPPTPRPPRTHFKYSEGGSGDLEDVGRMGGRGGQFASDI